MQVFWIWIFHILLLTDLWKYTLKDLVALSVSVGKEYRFVYNSFSNKCKTVLYQIYHSFVQEAFIDIECKLQDACITIDVK